MDRRFKVKVWKDRLASARPAKWSWEVVDRVSGGKVVGCGTTFSQTKSQEAAARAVEQREAWMERCRASKGGGRYRMGWPAETHAMAFADHPARGPDF